MNEIDIIELKLPLKPEHVCVARLTTSSILNRIGMDIDTIEDIKVAVSEVCNKLINLGSSDVENYTILYELTKKKVNIIFKCQDRKMKCIFEGNEIGLSLINALMDNVDLCSKEDYIISFSKSV